MVAGTPYIHFKINNETTDASIDYTHTWATTVETTKGPVNQPVLVNSAEQAYNIFGVDMNPYFVQGADSLIIVRVSPVSTVNSPQKGSFYFATQDDIIIYRAQQATTRTTYSFISYSDDTENATEWGTGMVEATEVTSGDYSQVIVRTNSTDASFVGKKFYIISSAKTDGTKYELFTDAGTTSAGIYVSITKNRQYTHKLYYTVDNNKVVIVIQERDENGLLIQESYIDSWNEDGTRKDDARQYTSANIKPYFTPTRYIIKKGTPLFILTTKYEGDYGITVSIKKSMVDNEGSYDIVLTDPALGSIKMSHVYDVNKIVNRINDSRLNFTAQSTLEGNAINEAMNSPSTYVSLYKEDDFDIKSKNITSDKLISNSVKEGTFLTTSIDTNNNVSVLSDIEAKLIADDEENASVSILKYQINLKPCLNQPLIGSSNGEWDLSTNRIPVEYRGEAHEYGLNTLRKIRIAGIFCMYEDNSIQLQYVYHGKNPTEPEKSMNNNETCKWRSIILGANHLDRASQYDLAAKASELNDQYILLLGQGLIDTGFNGIGSTLSAYQKLNLYGLTNEHQLLPCECTQYIAGLRSKLNYNESIFGGQGRKRIRGVGELSIAPLLSDENVYSWNPKEYAYLNESGVLTFTEDYGQITLTDGVTTSQTNSEEDEESVVSILKYVQNGIYDICLPYIGRNINGDLERSIEMEIKSFLETMKSSDQSLIDTDEFSAYDVDISLGSRNTQLLGKIFIYLKITPVHVLRQIEVEMTVQ